jgi:hypothetical protein
VNEKTIRAVTQGLLALTAVGGGLAYALLAQAQGHSPEPPAWLAVLIGGAVTYFYASTAHINGQTAALTVLAQTMAARRAADPIAAVTGGTDPTQPAGD